MIKKFIEWLQESIKEEVTETQLRPVKIGVYAGVFHRRYGPFFFHDDPDGNIMFWRSIFSFGFKNGFDMRDIDNVHLVLKSMVSQGILDESFFNEPAIRFLNDPDDIETKVKPEEQFPL